MKVVCSKDEFGLLVRACECNVISDTCRGCLFYGLCMSAKDTGVEGIEDLCEISTEG